MKIAVLVGLVGSKRVRRRREDFIDGDMILCKDCNLWQDKSVYRYRAARDMYEAKCLTCRNLYKRANNFSMEVQQLQTLLQLGCNACGSFDNLHIDHDHACCPDDGKSCGKCIRGILCHKCNTALGLLNDSLERLASLANYLRATS